MDQREEYWGDPILHDPEVYSSAQPPYESIHPQHRQSLPTSGSYPPHLASPAHGNAIVPQHLQHHHHHHHALYDHPQQQQQQQLYHSSRQNTSISVVDVLCGRGKTSFNHGKSVDEVSILYPNYEYPLITPSQFFQISRIFFTLNVNNKTVRGK